MPGVPGHGSMMLKNTAGEKVQKLLERFINFRDSQMKRLDENSKLTVVDVTTLNITKLSGGVQSNVVPPEYKVTVDMRLALDIDHVEFDEMLRRWCDESGDGIDYTFEQKQPKVAPTIVDESNPYWVALRTAIDDL